MKNLLILSACILLAGCDYTAPLVKTPSEDIDKTVVGQWQRELKESNKSEKLLVLALDSKEYLVVYSTEHGNTIYARGCLCHAAGLTFVQLKWFGNGQAEAPDDNRVYQFVGYSVAGNKLTVRMLNPDVVKRDAATSEELAREILAAKDNPHRFKEEMVFTKANK
ncbi:MAG: hypothetical protein PHD76_04590 [Methylacidiphilales bacterium]|nr:hypothetical protein [Candidatus Methylacidiphilales bacterium]